MTDKETFKAIHHGRNVRRLREASRIEEATLAKLLGEGWTPKRVSQIENTEKIEPALIEELAKALRIAPDAIKNLSEDLTINYIQNNYDHSTTNINHNSGPITINNPLERLIELQAEIKQLFEASLREKEKKITFLEKLFSKKKKK